MQTSSSSQPLHCLLQVKWTMGGKIRRWFGLIVVPEGSRRNAYFTVQCNLWIQSMQRWKDEGGLKQQQKIATYRWGKKPLNKKWLALLCCHSQTLISARLCHTTRAGRLHVLTFNLCTALLLCIVCCMTARLCVCHGVCSQACSLLVT